MTRFQPVLVVEDNPLDLDLICRAFERCKLANPIESDPESRTLI
jgi:hypothetical protein